MRTLWRIINALMGLQFIFAAVLQYNDPDPLRWAAIYLAAAVPCGLAMTRRPHWVWPSGVGVVSLAWAMTYLVRGVPTVSPWHMFDEWEMKNQQVLETREMFGLLLVVVWMLVLVIAAVRSRRQ